MKKFKILFLFLFILVVAGTYLAGSAYAMKYPNFMMHKFMRRRKIGMGMRMFNIFMLKKKLRLTKNQIRQIMTIKRQELKAFKSNIENFRNPMLSAIKSGTFNKSVFVSDITNKVKNMAEIRANFFAKFFNILTLKQRNRFVFLIKKMLDRKIKHLEFMKKMLDRKIKIMKENLAE